MNWKIALAKQKFSRVVQDAMKEPQIISNRDKKVAVLIDYNTYEELLAQKKANKKTIGSAFNELRKICKEEKYTLKIPLRKNRKSVF